MFSKFRVPQVFLGKIQECKYAFGLYNITVLELYTSILTCLFSFPPLHPYTHVGDFFSVINMFNMPMLQIYLWACLSTTF